MSRSKARWWRNLAAAVALLGAVAGLALLTTEPSGQRHEWREVCGIVAACLALYAFCSLPFAQRTYRRELRLRRGDGVLGRWLVSRSEWSRFLEHEARTHSDAQPRVNLVDLRQRAGSEGVEVIVGNDAVVVGDEFLSLTGLGMLGGTPPRYVESSPAMLEYEVTITDATDSFVPRVVRFPVGAQSEELARSLVSERSTAR